MKYGCRSQVHVRTNHYDVLLRHNTSVQLSLRAPARRILQLRLLLVCFNQPKIKTTMKIFKLNVALSSLKAFWLKSCK